jgi:hypothetical protein
VSAFQHLSIQETALRAAGCHVIRTEKRSETTTEGCEELRTVLDSLRKRYCSVTRIGRLARSIGETFTTTWAQGDCDRVHQTQEAARMLPRSTPLRQ